MSWVRYRVVGRVQGVGFRAFVVRLAYACGVHGAVRNEPDGAVLALAAGDEEALGRFRAGLERGPPAARVVTLEESKLQEGPESELFDVSF